MRLRLIGVVAGVAVAAGGVRAQENRVPTRPPGVYQPSKDARPVILVRAGKLTGAAVRGTNETKLGEVADLIISRKRGRVEFALVGHGGLLGVGEKLTPVPYAAFSYAEDKGALDLAMTEEAFKAAPTIEDKAWATLADPACQEPILSAFGVGREEPAEIEAPQDRPGNPPRLSDKEFPLLRVSDLKRQPLVADDGREVGAVEDLVVDAASGRVALVVVKYGGVIGIGEERVPAPWAMFDVNREGKLYAVRLDKEELRTAPPIKDKDWAELKSPGFAAEVYKHFGRSASWLEGGVPAARRMTAYDTLCASGLAKRVDGTITAVETARPMEGVPEVVMLTVAEGPGPATRVHLAPRSFLEGQGVEFKAGQPVRVEGRSIEVNGRRVVAAVTVTPAEGKALTLRRPDGTCMWQW